MSADHPYSYRLIASLGDTSSPIYKVNAEFRNLERIYADIGGTGKSFRSAINGIQSLDSIHRDSAKGGPACRITKATLTEHDYSVEFIKTMIEIASSSNKLWNAYNCTDTAMLMYGVADSSKEAEFKELVHALFDHEIANATTLGDSPLPVRDESSEHLRGLY
jgi:hypothetical protein